MVRARIGVYRRALQVIADHADAVVICGEHLDGQSLSTRERHQQVMTHVIADVDEFAGVHGGHVLLIADDHEMVGQLRDDLALYQHNRPDSRVIDTIHFVSSVAGPLVQAADLATFITRRAEAGDERAPRVALRSCSPGVGGRVSESTKAPQSGAQGKVRNLDPKASIHLV